jgi:hypothetical protein
MGQVIAVVIKDVSKIVLAHKIKFSVSPKHMRL